jgi:hypothetical protein
MAAIERRPPSHRLLTRALQQPFQLLVQVDLAAGHGVLDPAAAARTCKRRRPIVSRSSS